MTRLEKLFSDGENATKKTPQPGTCKAGVGIGGMGVMRGDLVMRSLIPVVMAGVLGIYGLISSVIIIGKLSKPHAVSSYTGFALLAAGLTVGLSSMAAGYAIGIVGDAGVRCNALCNGRLKNNYIQKKNTFRWSSTTVPDKNAFLLCKTDIKFFTKSSKTSTAHLSFPIPRQTLRGDDLDFDFC